MFNAKIANSKIGRFSWFSRRIEPRISRGLQAYAPWGGEHLLGTDQIGRDVFSRLIFAARNTLGICFLACFMALIIGTVLGIIAAIDRKYIDQILGRSVDTLMSIPVMIFTLMLLSVFGPTTFNLIVILGILESTRFFRISRSVAVGQVVLEYVEVARLRGEKLSYIILVFSSLLVLQLYVF